MSNPLSAVKEAVHLLPADELFRRDYSTSTGVTVCGELVTSGPDSEEGPHYCGDCVREALRWCAQPGAGERRGEITVGERVPGERARIVVQGRRSDDGSIATLVIIHEENGSWSIHGLGVSGVRLSKTDMTAVAESILGRVR